MFRDAEQVIVFVNSLEKFMIATALGDPVQRNETRKRFEEYLMAISGISAVLDTTPDTLLCPDCGGEMALRTNKSNGNKFWGCKKFPNCRGTRDENGLSREEREAQKYKKEVHQESGFSFNKDKRNPVTEVEPPKQDYSFNPFRK